MNNWGPIRIDKIAILGKVKTCLAFACRANATLSKRNCEGSGPRGRVPVATTTGSWIRIGDQTAWLRLPSLEGSAHACKDTQRRERVANRPTGTKERAPSYSGALTCRDHAWHGTWICLCRNLWPCHNPYLCQSSCLCLCPLAESLTQNATRHQTEGKWIRNKRHTSLHCIVSDAGASKHL